jgi:hypothetical protein
VVLPVVSSPFQAPSSNYFEGLAGSILAKINEERLMPVSEVGDELNAVAPLLNTISKENVYSLPEGYFNEFSVEIPGVSKTPAKIVAFSSVKRRWISYAAAAIIAGLVLTIAYFLTSESSTGFTKRAYTNLNISKSISTLSDGEIMRYLNNEPEVDIAVNPYEINMRSTDNIRIFLRNVSDEEIKDYLNENREPGEKRNKGI